MVTGEAIYRRRRCGSAALMGDDGVPFLLGFILKRDKRIVYCNSSYMVTEIHAYGRMADKTNAWIGNRWEPLVCEHDSSPRPYCVVLCRLTLA